MDNNILRKTLLEKRLNLKSEEVALYSAAVTKAILKEETVKNAKTVMVYNSIKNEVDTEMLKKELLKNGKTLVYPVIKNGEMYAAINLSNSEEERAFKIKEPSIYEIVFDVDVVIVPLVGCDKNLNRIGFGKGFYDRFLKDKKAYKIGVCYDFQVVDKITANEWDVKLNKIITPTKVIE